MIALVEHEHLGLVGEPAERGGMDDSVAIAAEGAAGGAGGSGISPAAAAPRIRRKGRAEEGCDHHDIRSIGALSAALLTLAAVALNYHAGADGNPLGCHRIAQWVQR